MKMFIQPSAVYLHRDPVDFRKQIDGLAAIVELTMKQSLSSGALFVFCRFLSQLRCAANGRKRRLAG
jgi:hypothetical protein